MKTEKVRLGIIGLGGIGIQHYRNATKNLKAKASVTAVCDKNPKRFDEIENGILRFSSSKELIRSKDVDGVIISTPHYSHSTIGSEALESGLHVLVEKPVSVHKIECEKLIQAYKQRAQENLVFAAMFNQRTDPMYLHIRDMLKKGELGELRRMNWIITDWFRTEHYYKSGGWRATWKGEGGGILLNQCPHQLDLIWWLFGSPSKVWAECRFGQWHDIEVEDDVTALLTFPNGATLCFNTTTGETPGTNRLEIVGDHGTLVADKTGLYFNKNQVPISVFNLTSKELFSKPPTDFNTFNIERTGDQHSQVLENFCDAILNNTSLIAPAYEGIHSVELANSMLLSTFMKQTITLPLDGKIYWDYLQKRIAGSRFSESNNQN